MREIESRDSYRKLLKQEVKVDRNKAVPRCRKCCYYHPEFKYRRHKAANRLPIHSGSDQKSGPLCCLIKARRTHCL